MTATKNNAPAMPLRSLCCRMIRTKYLGPTNTRGSRIKAWSVGAGDRPGFRLTVSYRCELGTVENHELAATELLRRIDAEGGYSRGEDVVLGSSEDGGGYVFAFVASKAVGGAS